MASKYAIILCVLILCAALIEGQGTGGRRCLCKKLSKKLRLKGLIKIEVYPVHSRCENVEYVATIKGSKKTKCLSPKAKLLNEILSAKGKLQSIKVIRYE
ncbi:C-X-C motif chemokine 11-1-like [Xenopus laevis]|uniref:C-X-C motif chemokine 11-1-like n=2 Tax=Xenopus laevis TaxID=8355 RepID=A0A1L8HVH5_XENLA|nr:C-X-C motif chemokine 11-1-like [Xenopus laevis]OCU00061.1 hypothetical protein XELAEV_18005844mg [Xenopus laevis]BBC77307.1 C-X-C motif chemokine ligand [Xenopus laevis]